MIDEDRLKKIIELQDLRKRLNTVMNGKPSIEKLKTYLTDDYKKIVIDNAMEILKNKLKSIERDLEHVMGDSK